MKAAVVPLVMLAVVLAACQGEGDPRETAPTSRETYQSATYDEAARVLGFDLVIPTPLPTGTRLSEGVWVKMEDGTPISALFTVYPADPLVALSRGSLSVHIEESPAPPGFALEMHQPIEVAGARVLEHILDFSISYVWEQSGVHLHASATWRDVTNVTPEMRADALAVVESMIAPQE
jgi:hypothetical protein